MGFYQTIFCKKKPNHGTRVYMVEYMEKHQHSQGEAPEFTWWSTQFLVVKFPNTKSVIYLILVFTRTSIVFHLPLS